MAYVYRHTRLDTNEVFYIGIGSDEKTHNRAYRKKGTKIWMRILNKTEILVEILHTGIEWEKACEIEKELIFLYGRADLGTGTLVNFTDGGEGTPGRVRPKHEVEKFSGSNNGSYGKCWIKNGDEESLIKKEFLHEFLEKGWEKGRVIKEETKNKISEKAKGRKAWNSGKKGIYAERFSRERILKMYESRRGKHQSEITRKKRSESMKKFIEEKLKNKKPKIKIYNLNNGLSKMIELEDYGSYQKESWIKFPEYINEINKKDIANNRKCWINKNGKNLLIDKSLLTEFMNYGWQKGVDMDNDSKERLSTSTKNNLSGRIGVYDPITNKNKKIKEEDLEKYLINGWVKGSSPLEKEKIAGKNHYSAIKVYKITDNEIEEFGTKKAAITYINKNTKTRINGSSFEKIIKNEIKVLDSIWKYENMAT